MFDSFAYPPPLCSYNLNRNSHNFLRSPSEKYKQNFVGLLKIPNSWTSRLAQKLLQPFSSKTQTCGDYRKSVTKTSNANSNNNQRSLRHIPSKRRKFTQNKNQVVADSPAVNACRKTPILVGDNMQPLCWHGLTSNTCMHNVRGANTKRQTDTTSSTVYVFCCCSKISANKTMNMKLLKRNATLWRNFFLSFQTPA